MIPKTIYYTCQLCGEDDFDDIGLYLHYKEASCPMFVRLAMKLAREMEQRAARRASRDGTAGGET